MIVFHNHTLKKTKLRSNKSKSQFLLLHKLVLVVYWLIDNVSNEVFLSQVCIIHSRQNVQMDILYHRIRTLNFDISTLE